MSVSSQTRIVRTQKDFCPLKLSGSQQIPLSDGQNSPDSATYIPKIHRKIPKNVSFAAKPSPICYKHPSKFQSYLRSPSLQPNPTVDIVEGKSKILYLTLQLVKLVASACERSLGFEFQQEWDSFNRHKKEIE